MQPLVSVTIISYNQKAYLPEAIDSILAQDYPNIELIIADDGSTDGSQDIIQNYASEYPQKITALLAEKNQGTSDNRHQSFKASHGKYIALLDSDDIAEPTRISEQVAIMESDERCTLCYSNVYIIRNDDLSQKGELFFNQERTPYEGNYRTLLQQDNFIPVAGTMIRANILDERGYHFDAGYTYSEGHLFVRVTRRGTLRYIDKVLGGYRRHDNSAMASSYGTRSGVRMRKEKALMSIYKEFSEHKKLTRYALARAYVDGYISCIKDRDYMRFLYYIPWLMWLLPETVTAYRDRRKQRYTLPGIR